jgi:HTH-type transcriptional regulator/antitoxin HigA
MNPRVIKSDADYEEALARIDEIFEAKPGSPEGIELELLATLVEFYEEKTFPVDLPDPLTAIRFRMEQQGLRQKDLVPYIGSASKVSEVLAGKRSLSLTMIRNLVDGLSIPAEVLLQEPGAQLRPCEEDEAFARFPIAEMVKRGWFEGFKGTASEARRQLEDLVARFVGPLSPEALQPAYLRQHVRIKDRSDPPALLAWHIRVLNLALGETTCTYKSGTLTTEFMSELRRLSTFESGPQLAREFLGKAGIRVVIEKHLRKTYLDGAASLLPEGSPVVGLTLRYDRLDHFWFTLFHELAHVALHLDRKGSDGAHVFFDDFDREGSDRIEREADTWAADALIPPEKWKAGKLGRKGTTPAQVVAFADALRISPAIPAGRLRFERDDYSLYSDLIGWKKVRRQFGS